MRLVGTVLFGLEATARLARRSFECQKSMFMAHVLFVAAGFVTVVLVDGRT